MLEGVASSYAGSDSPSTRSTAHHPQASSHVRIRPRLSFDMRPSQLLALRRRTVLPLPPVLSCRLIVTAASETDVSRTRWIGPHGSALASVGEQAAAPLQSWGPGRTNLQSCSRKQPVLWGSVASQCTRHVTVKSASIGYVGNWILQ